MATCEWCGDWCDDDAGICAECHADGPPVCERCSGPLQPLSAEDVCAKCREADDTALSGPA